MQDHDYRTAGSVTLSKSEVESILHQLFTPPRADEDNFHALIHDPSHLDMGEIHAFLEHQMRGKTRTEAVRHLNQCGFCRMRLIEQSEIVQAPSLPFWYPAQQALERVTRGIWTAESRLPEPVAFAAYGSEDPEFSDNALTFLGGDASGSYEVQGNCYLIHLEHHTWPVGTLACVEFLDADEQPIWAQWGVFKEDWGPTSVDLVTQQAQVVECVIRLRLVDLTQWEADEATTLADVLLETFENVAVTDTASRRAWHRWAEQTLSQPCDAALLEAARIVHTQTMA